MPQNPEIVEQAPLTQNMEPRMPTTVETDPISLLAKAIGLIVFFSLLLYLFLRTYKYFTQGQAKSGQSPKIKILGSSSIGPKKSLCMVDVLDHLLVLGVTDSQISVLLDLPWENLDEELKRSLLNEKTGGSTPNFSALLKTWMRKS